MLLFRFCRALAKIQALLVFCLGFACRQKPNVLECALALMSVILFIVVVFFTLTGNGLHMACGGFEALSCPPKPKLATERMPYWLPFTRHKLYAVLAQVFFFFV